jgi:hypothetical protein
MKWQMHFWSLMDWHYQKANYLQTLISYLTTVVFAQYAVFAQRLHCKKNVPAKFISVFETKWHSSTASPGGGNIHTLMYSSPMETDSRVVWWQALTLWCTQLMETASENSVSPPLHSKEQVATTVYFDKSKHAFCRQTAELLNVKACGTYTKHHVLKS